MNETQKQVSPYETVDEFKTAQPDAYEYAFKSNLLKKLCKKHNWEMPYFKKVSNRNENAFRTRLHLQGYSPKEIEKRVANMIQYVIENPNYLTETINNNTI